MRRLSSIAAIAVIAVLWLSLSLPGVALAHERRTIGNGKYDVVVGFDKEPAFANQPNAASIRIMKAGTQDPVEGVEKTLKVGIAFGGGQPKEFPLRAVFGQKGYYVADYIPTKAGSYIWTFTGDIEGTPINERFESGPGRFNDVESTEALQFPVTAPDPVAMSSDLKAARDEAASARTFGLVGTGLGLLGLIVGGLSFLSRRRPESAPRAAREPVR